MKSFILQLICLGGLLTVLSACRSKDPEVQPGAIIETAIPGGLVPGSALTLKGRDFGAVTSVQFANTSVASGQFMRTATNELTVKVPIGTQAGAVRVAGEKGPGQPKQMMLLTGGTGITTDNVSTNVTTITQSYFSDNCSPYFLSLCYKGTCVGYLRNNKNPISECSQNYYTLETIAGSTYEVLTPRPKYQQLILKFERKSGGSEYTGLVLIKTPTGDNYAGSVLKDNNIVGYSLTDGSVLKLCRLNVTNFNPANRDDLCPPNGCSACQ